MTHFDLVILGAGPAGAAAAVTALKSGISVALIDKAQFPRDKLCGGLITGRCATHLQDVFGQNIDGTLIETRHNFNFFMDGERLAELRDAPPAHLTMRWDFDNVLYRHAIAAGAVDCTGRRVQILDIETGQLKLDTDETLTFRCLIGTDGVHSMIAKQLFGTAFDKRKIGFALEIEDISQPNQNSAPIRVDFAAANWGYGWSFPKRQSTTIGIGGLQRENPDMKTRLNAYLRVLDAKDPAKVKGHFIPFGSYRKRPGRKNVLLAGDAAGFVDPITGEGIGYAIQSGAMAGTAAAKAILAGQPDTAFARYLPATRPIRTALRAARMLRPVIFARLLRPFFSSAFRSSKTLKHEYMRLLAGQTEYPQILARSITRLPRAMVRFLMRGQYGRQKDVHL